MSVGGVVTSEHRGEISNHKLILFGTQKDEVVVFIVTWEEAEHAKICRKM